MANTEKIKQEIEDYKDIKKLRKHKPDICQLCDDKIYELKNKLKAMGG